MSRKWPRKPVGIPDLPWYCNCRSGIPRAIYMHTPNLGLGVAFSAWGREQSRFRGSFDFLP